MEKNSGATQRRSPVMPLIKLRTLCGIVVLLSLLAVMRIAYISNNTVFRGEEPQAIPRTKVNRPKVTHIGFLKVHKAGSTTMQNMFFRFGMNQNLIIVLPEEKNFVNNRNMPLKLKIGEHYDLFAVHTIYSKDMFKDLLPSDAAFIGIVREPLDRMVSAAYYYRDSRDANYLKKIPKDTFIHDLVNKPDIYDKREFSKTRNTMARDFGFPLSLVKANKTVIKKAIDTLNEDFRLVLVMELFDESLILMRRYLRWTMYDVIYLKANAHSHLPANLSSEETEKFRSTCFLDYAIYDRFKQELDRKIILEGEDFELEVNRFRSVLLEVSSFCSKNISSALTVDASPWNERFTVTSETCKWMTTKEITFIEALRLRMFKLHPN